MLLLFEFFIYHSISYAPQSSIFIGDLFNKFNSSYNQSNVLMKLFFYYLKDDQNILTLEQIKSSNTRIDHISPRNNPIFILGKIFTISQHIIAGVYQKSTSEIYMINELERFIPKEEIKNESYNPPIIKNNSLLFSFLMKIKSISEEFNYNITKNEIQANDDYIPKEDFVSQLILYSLKKFNNSLISNLNEKNFPIIYLKVNINNTLKMKYEINICANGFYSVEKSNNITYNFHELRTRQIDIQILFKKERIFTEFLIFSLPIFCILIVKINSIGYKISPNSFFYIMSYDFLFAYFCCEIFQKVKLIEFYKLVSLLMLLCIIRFCVFIWNMQLPFSNFQRIAHNYNNLLFLFSMFINLALNMILIIGSLNVFEDTTNILIIHILLNLVPQIISNLFNRMRNFNVTTILIALTYYRFYEISCYFLYLQNDGRKILIFTFICITVQCLVLLIQTKCGPFYSLKIKKYYGFNYHKKMPQTNNICSICYSEINHDSNDCVITPCNHVFHGNCLQSWMKIKKICPICKTNLPPADFFYVFI